MDSLKEGEYDALLYTPTWIIEKGNEYVIRMVGEKNFRDFIFDVEETERWNENVVKYEKKSSPSFRYKLVYRNKVLGQFAGGKNVWGTSIEIDANGEIVLGAPYGIPDCSTNASLCDIVITKEKAFVIAKAKGLNPESQKFRYYIGVAQETKPGWAWHFQEKVGSLVPHGCIKTKALEVNLSTGKVGELLQVGPTLCS